MASPPDSRRCNTTKTRFFPNQNPSESGDRSSKKAILSMADSVISLDKVKAFWNAQVHDDEKWAFNMKLMRAAGLFGGSIFLMRQFGDLMAV